MKITQQLEGGTLFELSNEGDIDAKLGYLTVTCEYNTPGTTSSKRAELKIRNTQTLARDQLQFELQITETFSNGHQYVNAGTIVVPREHVETILQQMQRVWVGPNLWL